MTELVSKQVGNHICQVQRVWMGRCSQQDCVNKGDKREKMGSRVDWMFRTKSRKCSASFYTGPSPCSEVGVVSKEGLSTRYFYFSFFPISYSNSFLILKDVCLCIAEVS